MKGRRKLYMHTLDDRPAEFIDGGIYFAGYQVRRFATSLEQIRAEQQHDRAERDRLHVSHIFKYGYRLLQIPEQDGNE